MATINDIGVPGQPMNHPPLTEWQAAVRDAIPRVGVHKALTTADGRLHIPHGMSAPPRAALLSHNYLPGAAVQAKAKFTLFSIDATTITVVVLDSSTGGLYANVEFSVTWMAVL